MRDLNVFTHRPLRGGLLLQSVSLASEPMIDALGRPAVARTLIIGNVLEIELESAMSDEEISISLYHEVLEGATVALAHPPAGVLDLNEAGFELAAQRAHADFGPATPAGLDALLAAFGF